MTSTTTFFAKSNSASHQPDESEMGEVCIANISPKERKKRAQFAVQQLLFTLGILVVLVILDINPLWRLLLFFMFSAASTSYIQALDKT